MKIVFLDADTVGNVDNLHRFKDFGEFIVYGQTSAAQVTERIQQYEVVITNKVIIDREVMEQAPNLKLICASATGTNNIDKACAQERGIQVKNVSDYSTNSVAQHTFSLILGLLNHHRYYDLYVKTGAYGRQSLFTHLDRPIWELSGKKFGIIGLGNIGKQVALIAEAFGAEIVYYSSSGKDRHDRYQRLELSELMAESDVVSIHAPLTEQTRNLIRYKELSWMKSTALLINTGRGGIVNEADLARAIDENLIQGAGIDVFTEEPLPGDNPLMQINNKEKIIMTPHNAWGSIEARNLLMDKVYENIKAFVK